MVKTSYDAVAETTNNDGAVRMLINRSTPRIRFSVVLAAALAMSPAASRVSLGAAAPPDPPSCALVRLSDIGWTDVTSTTAVFAHLLGQLGYQTRITVLSVPVTYASLKNKDIDVFLGNWMPSMAADRQPFIDDGSVEIVGPNLIGARYTLAVPEYTYQAGLHDFADIQKFAAGLNRSIYGIEPGNDGNRHILEIIKQNQFGLGDFKLVESSEQGMLAEVERAIAAHRPIVFLGWDPHPMNTRFKLRYLTGGDATFGPNFGGATVYTNVRAGYAKQCPNVGRLLENLKFTTVDESEIMGAILQQQQSADVAAANWIKAHPAKVASWLVDVRTLDGRPAQSAVERTDRPAAVSGLETWVTGHKLPVGDQIARGIEFIKAHGRGFFNSVSAVIGGAVDGLTHWLLAIPPLISLGAMSALAYGLRRSWPLALFVALALLFILNQGYWAATQETLSLVTISTLAATAVGIPIGIAAAHRPRLFAALRPVLDLMQTLPTFVYLIPTLVLFGLGVVPGIISTVIFALPAPIRLTHLGISSVPLPLREAGLAFGATPMQLLWKVELPSARKSILAGVTQCIMLSLSMVVIAALVGAGGLGVPVVRALNSVQVGMGFEAGIAIVLLAIVIDRMTRPAESAS
jgi:glycine betaine/proline transport system substrate-binding protein